MITYKEIILRDFIESDIEKRINWQTTETEWQLWDAPWEYEQLTESQRQEELEKYIETMKTWIEKYKEIPESTVRRSFQIATKDGQYIGWCNSYNIDKEFNYTDSDGYCTVGIDIPDLSMRGKGLVYQALCPFIKYLQDNGMYDIYTQTWSGNERMIRAAIRLGFEECCRKKSLRFVRGKAYDGLTFKLNVEKFKAFFESMDEY